MKLGDGMYETGIMTGRGYLRPDGKKGIRNIVLIIYTVGCSTHVAVEIARHFQGSDIAVDVVGCETCIDYAVMIKRLLCYTRHPNVGAVLVVGHGCEFVQAEQIAAYAAQQGRPSAWFLDQDFGTAKGIAHGVRLVKELHMDIKGVPNAPFSMKDLLSGAVLCNIDQSCKAAGIAFGQFSDSVVRAGGTMLFSDVMGFTDYADRWISRCADEHAARNMSMTLQKMRHYLSEGNMANSGANWEDDCGVMEKSGAAPILGVLKIARFPERAGLWYLDAVNDYLPQMDITPPDPAAVLSGPAAAAMEIIAIGAQMVFLITGEGSLTGTPISPLIKLTANEITYGKLSDDIDMLLRPGGTDELLNCTASIADGRLAKSELHGWKDGRIFASNQDAQVIGCPERNKQK